MKTFFRKLAFSLFAMGCGWIACNITGFVALILQDALEGLDPVPIIVVLQVGLVSGMVILAAWFFVFLPVDLIVPAASRLRKPGVAALCGFLASLTLLAVIWLSEGGKGQYFGALPIVLGTCATGTVAAYVRARMDKPQPPARP